MYYLIPVALPSTPQRLLGSNVDLQTHVEGKLEPLATYDGSHHRKGLPRYICTAPIPLNIPVTYTSHCFYTQLFLFTCHNCNMCCTSGLETTINYGNFGILSALGYHSERSEQRSTRVTMSPGNDILGNIRPILYNPLVPRCT